MRGLVHKSVSWGMQGVAHRCSGRSYSGGLRKARHRQLHSHPNGNVRFPAASRTCFEGPFGELLRATGPMATNNPIRFSTKYQDAETDLVYYGYRYYSPATGRWNSRDPAEDRRNAKNSYEFVRNDPLRYVDKLGLFHLTYIGRGAQWNPDIEAFWVGFNFHFNAIDAQQSADLTAYVRHEVSLTIQPCPCDPRSPVLKSVNSSKYFYARLALDQDGQVENTRPDFPNNGVWRFDLGWRAGTTFAMYNQMPPTVPRASRDFPMRSRGSFLSYAEYRIRAHKLGDDSGFSRGSNDFLHPEDTTSHPSWTASTARPTAWDEQAPITGTVGMAFEWNDCNGSPTYTYFSYGGIIPGGPDQRPNTSPGVIILQ
jgi:RHS repeat-associated protein